MKCKFEKYKVKVKLGKLLLVFDMGGGKLVAANVREFMRLFQTGSLPVL